MLCVHDERRVACFTAFHIKTNRKNPKLKTAAVTFQVCDAICAHPTPQTRQQQTINADSGIFIRKTDVFQNRFSKFANQFNIDFLHIVLFLLF